MGSTVSFYETDVVLAKWTCPPFDLDVGVSCDVIWTWTVTDSVVLGNHTIYAQVNDAPSEDWSDITVTVMGLANVTLTRLVASSAAVFEGNNVTFTVRLFNNGTDHAENLTLTWSEGTTELATDTGFSVLKGETVERTFVTGWGSVDHDTNKTVTATIGTASLAVNVTVRDRAPLIEIASFTVPLGRIGDDVVFGAKVKNNGTGDANGIRVQFLDGTVLLNETVIFNLPVGSTMDVAVRAILAGTPDAAHTFFVRALDAEKNATATVGHRLAPAAISIAAFTASPARLENQPRDSYQSFELEVVIENSGEVAGSVHLTVSEGFKIIFNKTMMIDGGALHYIFSHFFGRHCSYSFVHPIYIFSSEDGIKSLLCCITSSPVWPRSCPLSFFSWHNSSSFSSQQFISLHLRASA
jgi:hypothetical protein